MFRSLSAGAAVALGLVTLSAPTAWAQTKHGSAGEEGYGYEFDDDPLNAGGFGSNEARIRVQEGPARVLLIRPRTTFVVEMYKSVEMF